MSIIVTGANQESGFARYARAGDVTGAIRVAIDIGGTFTDFQILDEATGEIAEFKVSTTPDDPSQGLVEGLRTVAKRGGVDLAAVKLLLHGTTIATNAILEHRFPEAALITTSGFEDVLEIGRHMRRDVYGLYAEERALLVPRSRRFGVRERIGANGQVVTSLDEADVRRVAARIATTRVDSVAVCLLNAFANPSHERRVREILASAVPGVDISLSTEVSPEIREYQRTSTTVLNALLVPIVRAYLEQLEARLAAAGVDATTLLIQSNGGVCTPTLAARQPARLLLSGPCGGAMAAERLAHLLGVSNLVAVDMGGTSCDISLVRDARAALVAEGEIEGCSVRLPMVEMCTVGAGGGSIARVDTTGRLRVGPQSTGADPGPACYGRGGRDATVTDANLVLGRIDSSGFLGGTMPLDREAASHAIVRSVGEPLGISFETAAEGILAIVNASMANAMRLSLFEKGLDPTDFALLAFGGAGGLHAAALAEEMGMTQIIFPRGASTLSAFGMLWTDIVHHAVRSRVLLARLDSVPTLRDLARDLLTEADELLASDRVVPAARESSLAADMRYLGQGYELTVPWPGTEVDGASLASAETRFHAAHRQRFLHADPEGAVEIIALRVTARGRLARPREAVVKSAGAETVVEGVRRVLLAGTWQELPVWRRSALGPDTDIAGPAVIEEDYTTILLPSGWRVAVAASGHLVARRVREGEKNAR